MGLQALASCKFDNLPAGTLHASSWLLFCQDLKLVAVATTGEIVAAFWTLWYDEAMRTAACKPVSAHPDHQQRGLRKTIITEGLRRVQSLGATLVMVGSCSDAAMALYAKVGFTERDLSEP